MDVSLDVLFEQEQVVNDYEGTKNDGMTTAEEAEQTVSVIDGGEEDTVVEDQLDRLKKQYDAICETWTAYRIACDRLTKEEEMSRKTGWRKIHGIGQ